MIISHKHKFIFLKTVKTAGTSIQAALAEHCGEKDVITGEGEKNIHKLPKIPTLHHEHVYLTFVKQWLGPKIWDNYFKFAFIRNPFDLAISKYYWDYKKRPDKFTNLKEHVSGLSEINRIHKINSQTVNHIENFRKYIKDGQLFGSFGGVVSDEEGTPMVYERLFEKHEYYPIAGKYAYANALAQYQSLNYEHTFYPWLCDDIFYKNEEGIFRINPNINPYNNGIDVDFVGRYEQLDEDINRISEKLGLKLKLPKLKTNTRDKTKKIHEYYNEETMFYIENYFKYDLDKFFKKDKI